MAFPTYKLKYKLHVLKKAPRIQPTDKAKTYQSINQQIQSIVQQVDVEFLYVVLNKLYVELEFGI